MSGGEGTLAQSTKVPFGGRRSHSEGAGPAGCAVSLRRQRGGDGGGGGRVGWLARSRQSAARGPAGAALPPPGASEEAVAEGGSPAPAGARCEPPGSPAGRRPPGALFRSGAGGVAGGVACSTLAGLRYAAPGCTRAAGSTVPVRGLRPYHPLWRKGVQRRSRFPLRPKWGGPSLRSDRLL